MKDSLKNIILVLSIIVNLVLSGLLYSNYLSQNDIVENHFDETNLTNTLSQNTAFNPSDAIEFSTEKLGGDYFGTIFRMNRSIVYHMSGKLHGNYAYLNSGKLSVNINDAWVDVDLQKGESIILDNSAKFTIIDYNDMLVCF